MRFRIRLLTIIVAIGHFFSVKAQTCTSSSLELIRTTLNRDKSGAKAMLLKLLNSCTDIPTDKEAREIERLKKVLLPVQKKQTVISKLAAGNSTISPKRDPMSWKMGYVNEAGKFVIAPKFDDAEPFYKGTAMVAKGDNYGFINEKGFEIIPFGFYKLIRGKDKLDIVDISSKTVIPPGWIFQSTGYLFDITLNRVVVKKGERMGLFDCSLQHFIIDPEFDEMSIYDYGYSSGFLSDVSNAIQEIPVLVKKGKEYGIVSLAGKKLLPLGKYDEIKDDLSDGLIEISKEEYAGFIDQKMTEIIEPIFHRVGTPEYGLIPVQDSFYNRWGYLDYSGRPLISCRYLEYKRIEAESDLLPVKNLDKKWQFVDRGGMSLKNLEFDDAFPFMNKYAAVKEGINWKVIDRNGNFEKLKYNFDDCKVKSGNYSNEKYFLFKTSAKSEKHTLKVYASGKMVYDDPHD